MGKKSEEMIPAPAEAERNIRNVVEDEIVYSSEKFSINPSFLVVRTKRIDLTDALQLCVNFFLEVCFCNPVF